MFVGHLVEDVPDGEGGAFVVVSEVGLGTFYVQTTTWLGFHISYLHPAADVYPHYVRPDLERSNGHGLGVGLSPTNWAFRNTAALQVSRRSTHWDARRDTAALKALKVLAWLREPS